MKKNKIFILVIFLSLSLAQICYSQESFWDQISQRELELQYPQFGPDFPDIPPPTTTKTYLPDYLVYAYYFLISIVGLVCFITLIMAGFKILTSAGNPAAYKNAQEQILASILGIALTLGSYLLSQTINPELVIPEVPEIGFVGSGVKISDGTHVATLTSSVEDTGEPIDITTVEVSGTPLVTKAIFYPQPNFQGDPLAVVVSGIGTYEEPIAGIRSIKIIQQFPGVYICNQAYEYVAEEYRAICPGKEIMVSQKINLLDPDINDHIVGVRIVPEFKFKENLSCYQCSEYFLGVCYSTGGKDFCFIARKTFGITLHQHPDFLGKLQLIEGKEYIMNWNLETMSESEVIGERLAGQVSSVFPFAIPLEQNVFSGGVYLCEEKNPIIQTEPGQSSPPGCYGPFQNARGNFGEGDFADVPNADSCHDIFSTDTTGISSVVIFKSGDYLVILFDQNDFKGNTEVFIESDPDFHDNPIGRCCCMFGMGCEDCASSAIIMPLADIWEEGDASGEGAGGGTPPSGGSPPEGEPSPQWHCEKSGNTCTETNLLTNQTNTYTDRCDGNFIFISYDCSSQNRCQQSTIDCSAKGGYCDSTIPGCSSASY